MRAAGYILTGLRRCRSRAHAPLILAYSLRSDFFGIEELEDWFPAYEAFAVWPATARLLWQIRRTDWRDIAGQSSLAHFGHCYDSRARRFILCTRKEARRGICHIYSMIIW